ncbi:MAG: TIGR01440 family protein [Clostridiaceae bacterium]|nr:TIGR01440 family protein [Clostridiaceae bacterium]
MSDDIKESVTKSYTDVPDPVLDRDFLKQIAEETESAITELVETANLKPGAIVVIGCSSSEIAGHRIGSYSSTQIGNVIYDTIAEVLDNKGIFMAAQCCEHLNRCVIIEQKAVLGAEIVNIVPWKKSGGSFASRAYEMMHHPVAVEKIQADAGLDIGDTFIGMHLKSVVVCVRTKICSIGNAHVTAARTRPKFVGGERARYDHDLSWGITKE